MGYARVSFETGIDAHVIIVNFACGVRRSCVR
jgi:hypothetical protein